MELKYDETTEHWYVNCKYEEKDIPKSEGFLWEPRAKRWQTKDFKIAKTLVRYATGEVRQNIISAMNKARQSLNLSKATSANLEIPKPEGLDYLPFQKAGIAYASMRDNTLIADEMGLGKTIQAIGIINLLKPSKVLIVCPASLKINWKNELEKWLVGKKYKVGIAEKPWPKVNILIINYERLLKYAGIGKIEFDLLILDECHYIKSDKAKRTKAVFKLNTKRKVLLTGTPIVNRPVELFTILELLKAPFIGKFWDYAGRYCDPVNNGFGWDYSGASNLDDLQFKLRESVMVRRLKMDVLTELPPKRRQIIPVPSDGYESQILKEEIQYVKNETRINDIKKEIDKFKREGDDKSYKSAVKKLTKAQIISFEEISKVRHETALMKIPAVIDQVKEILEAEHKIVIFAHHHDVIDGLKIGLEKYNPIVMTGDTKITDRQSLVDSFNTKNNIRLFICSIKTGGVGFSLQGASVVIFAELDWVPGNMTQAEDRLHGIGRGKIGTPLLIMHIVIDGSIDSKLAKTIVAKQTVIDKALDKKEEKGVY